MSEFEIIVLSGYFLCMIPAYIIFRKANKYELEDKSDMYAIRSYYGRLTIALIFAPFFPLCLIGGGGDGWGGGA